MAVRRTYVRPMDGWWRRDPFFVRYMAREATAIFVVVYAVILHVGVIRLSQGEEAFAGWLESLRSPGSIAFHVVLLAIFLYHTWSWFSIMPKTMAPVVVGGKRLPSRVITALGLVASALASLALLAVIVALVP